MYVCLNMYVCMCVCIHITKINTEEITNLRRAGGSGMRDMKRMKLWKYFVYLYEILKYQISKMSKMNTNSLQIKNKGNF